MLFSSFCKVGLNNKRRKDKLVVFISFLLDKWSKRQNAKKVF